MIKDDDSKNATLKSQKSQENPEKVALNGFCGRERRCPLGAKHGLASG
jgi:hypothetical protein